MLQAKIDHDVGMGTTVNIPDFSVSLSRLRCGP